MRKVLICLLLLWGMTGAWAQEPSNAVTADSLVVTGKVLDQNGEPILGARVRIFDANAEEYTRTDIEGNFRLVLPKEDSAIIVVCYGFLDTIVTKEHAEKIVLLEAEPVKVLRIL